MKPFAGPGRLLLWRAEPMFYIGSLPSSKQVFSPNDPGVGGLSRPRGSPLLSGWECFEKLENVQRKSGARE
jgi:hypothetical protein